MKHPTVIGKGNIVRRNLVGLDTRYPTDPKSKEEDYGFFMFSMITTAMLIVFPILSIIWVHTNFDFLNDKEIKIKFGTLYTDITPFKKAARNSITMLCSRRLFIALATVFLNQFTIVTFFIYC